MAKKEYTNRTGPLREELRWIPTSHILKQKQKQKQKLDMKVLFWKSHCIVRDKVDPSGLLASGSSQISKFWANERPSSKKEKKKKWTASVE